MTVVVVPRQETSQRLDQIGLRSAARLHEADSAGGMGRKDVGQTVTPPGDEPLDLRRELDNLAIRRVDLDLDAVHGPGSCRLAGAAPSPSTAPWRRDRSTDGAASTWPAPRSGGSAPG